MITDPKDIKILNLLSEGFITKQIALRVSLSYGGVRSRIDRLKQRYNAKNVAELIAKYKDSTEMPLKEMQH